MKFKFKFTVIAFILSVFFAYAIDKVSVNSNPVIIITFSIIVLYCSGLGFAVDMIIISREKKRKRNEQMLQQKREMEEKRRYAVNELTKILEEQYMLCENTNLYMGDYTDIYKLLQDNVNYPFYKELTEIYNGYIAKHQNRIAELLANGGEVCIKASINHYYHFCELKNQKQDLDENLIKVMTYFDIESFLFNIDDYGQIDLEMFNAINNVIVNNSVINHLSSVKDSIINQQQLCNLNTDFLHHLVGCLCSTAFRYPFNGELFSKEFNMYNHFTYRVYNDGYKNYRISSFDVMFAQIYSYYKMGKGVLDRIRSTIDMWINANLCTNPKNIILMASAMMWLENYDLELQLLRIAATNNVSMTSYVQERLRFLESGGSLGPVVYENVDNEKFCYDYSSINWKIEDFEILYKNLIFKNKNISYALAVSEFKKTFKSKNNQILKYENIFSRLLQMAKEEYMSEITCQKVTVNCLSETQQFDENAILIIPDNTDTKIDYIGELVFYDRIGVNINIRIITVFIPNMSVTIQENMSRVLNIKRENQPKLNIILNSLRDSIAREMDLLCDEKNQVSSIY